jgi:effector-binding domain-containing protein
MDYTIEQRHQDRQPYAAIRTTVPMGRIGEAMGPLYGELYGWLGQKGIQPTGEPWSRYLEVGPEEVEMEVAAPVAAEFPGEGRVIGGVLPACDVVATVHEGPYERIGEAYAALGAWIAEHGRQITGAMWEVYLTDHQQEPDPAKWRTLVCDPVGRA